MSCHHHRDLSQHLGTDQGGQDREHHTHLTDTKTSSPKPFSCRKTSSFMSVSLGLGRHPEESHGRAEDHADQDSLPLVAASRQGSPPDQDCNSCPPKALPLKALYGMVLPGPGSPQINQTAWGDTPDTSHGHHCATLQPGRLNWEEWKGMCLPWLVSSCWGPCFTSPKSRIVL